MKKNKFQTVNIPSSDLDRLREIAEQENRSMAKQIRHWIDQYLQSHHREAS